MEVEEKLLEYPEQSIIKLGPGVMKRSASSGTRRQCEGLLSDEYCICKFCDSLVEERCIQRCQSTGNLNVGGHPLEDYHSLVGKVLNQTECWVCSHVPQWQHNIGLVPFPLNISEVLELRGGRPIEGRYNNTRSPSLTLRQYSVDRSLLCLNISHAKRLENWEADLSDQTMARHAHFGERLRPPISRNVDGSHKLGRVTKHKKVSIGKVSIDNCKNVIHADTCLEQMETLGMGSFIETLCDVINGHTVPYVLPDDVYFVCGKKTYSWVTPSSKGLCFLAKLVPEIMTITHEEMVGIHKTTSPPYIHTQYEHRAKRNMIPGEDPIATKLISETAGFQVMVALDLTRTARGTLNFKYIQDLAKLIDNIIEMYDDTFRYTGRELQAYKKELVQHRLVLNYLTSITGGYCVTLATQFGVKCYMYIINNTDDPKEVIDRKMDEILQLKWEFRRNHNSSLYGYMRSGKRWQVGSRG
ncbi:uncharacterized protein LOC142151874 [Mixophyes fleayi]|uniref:uncharacterized protein LOC142151874 n=1 Tax=Mixophyes fleayi TaxID=3061075 RepID=UPI003F4DC53B